MVWFLKGKKLRGVEFAKILKFVNCIIYMIVMVIKRRMSIPLLILASCLIFLGTPIKGDMNIQGFSLEDKASPDMDVTIEMWDPVKEEWVDEINVAVTSQLTFRVYVHNVGDYDLFDVEIKCHLPPFLEYVENSSTPYTPDRIENNTIMWTVTSLFHCCGGEAFETYFVANVTDEGFGTCSLMVSASYEGGGIAKFVFVTVNAFYDTYPPFVDIVKPGSGLYISGKRVFPLPKVTVAIGKLSIEIESNDSELSIQRVELYIDGCLVANLTEPPYVYNWSERGFGRYEIRAVSYDTAGNHAEDSIRVLKIF